MKCSLIQNIHLSQALPQTQWGNQISRINYNVFRVTSSNSKRNTRTIWKMASKIRLRHIDSKQFMKGKSLNRLYDLFSSKNKHRKSRKDLLLLSPKTNCIILKSSLWSWNDIKGAKTIVWAWCNKSKTWVNPSSKRTKNSTIRLSYLMIKSKNNSKISQRNETTLVWLENYLLRNRKRRSSRFYCPRSSVILKN